MRRRNEEKKIMGYEKKKKNEGAGSKKQDKSNDNRGYTDTILFYIPPTYSPHLPTYPTP
jgi:hypothetical protein